MGGEESWLPEDEEDDPPSDELWALPPE